MPASAITAVWNGSAYYLFSDYAKALAFADLVISDFRDQNHPIGDASPESLITEGVPIFWFKGSYVREDGTFIGAIEAPPIVAGDESEVVAEAVTAWNQARDAAWNTD